MPKIYGEYFSHYSYPTQTPLQRTFPQPVTGCGIKLDIYIFCRVNIAALPQDTEMQMRSCRISGRTYCRNSIASFYLLTHTGIQFRTVHIHGICTSSMIIILIIVTIQYLHSYDAKSILNRLWRWDFAYWIMFLRTKQQMFCPVLNNYKLSNLYFKISNCERLFIFIIIYRVFLYCNTNNKFLQI